MRLGEEFHHNGLTLRCAQIGRVPRGLGPTWDRHRLSVETLQLLHERGEDIRRVLVTDVVPLAEAPALLADIAARRQHVLTAVFTTANEHRTDHGRGRVAGPTVWPGPCLHYRPPQEATRALPRWPSPARATGGWMCASRIGYPHAWLHR